MNKIKNIFKKICGIFCIIECFVGITITISIHGAERVAGIVSVFIFAFLAFLCFKKPKNCHINTNVAQTRNNNEEMEDIPQNLFLEAPIGHTERQYISDTENSYSTRRIHMQNNVTFEQNSQTESTPKEKWYFNTWLIGALYACWFIFGIPLAIGIILSIFKTRYEKKFFLQWRDAVADNQRYKDLLTPEMQDAFHLKKLTEDLREEEQKLNSSIYDSQNKLDELRKEIISFDDEILVQEFGLYKPMYEFAQALQYKEELEKVRHLQKDLIKSKEAVTGTNDWTVNGNKTQGKKMVSDTQKLLLRAFNTECDSIITKVRYTNFDASLNRIYKSAEAISKLGTIMHIAITQKYLDAKVQELHLAFEYQQKKQEEKEAEKAARAEQREQAKMQKELEEQQAKFEKEQSHYQTAYEKVLAQLNANPSDSDLLAKKSDLEKRLDDIDKALTDIDYRQANMRAGYVYVISNIGAFGENIYKIGMTRRLNPQDRVDELGDASVPFRFDVHAMIFSDDAPALEAALHRAFEDKKLNMVNQRREFFRVTLDEIKEVVRENYDKTVEFVDVPDAEQYRISEKMRMNIA